MKYRFEGGPLDGQSRETDGALTFRIPRPVPWNAPTDLGFSVWEYRRSGSVYRFETLINDAQSSAEVAAEVFIDPAFRRLLRDDLRRRLQQLAPLKELGPVVWAVRHDQPGGMFRVAAFVGGRRREHAAVWKLAPLDSL